MDGSRVVSGSKDKTVKVWNISGDDVNKWGLLHTLEGLSRVVSSVAISK